MHACARRGVCGARVAAARGGCRALGAVGASTCVCRRVLALPAHGGAATGRSPARPGAARPPPGECRRTAPRRGTGGETGKRGTGNRRVWGRPGSGVRQRGRGVRNFLGRAGSRGGPLPGLPSQGPGASFPLPSAPGGAVSPQPGTEHLAGSAAPARAGARGAAPRRAAQPALPSAHGRLLTKLLRSHF